MLPCIFYTYPLLMPLTIFFISVQNARNTAFDENVVPTVNPTAIPTFYNRLIFNYSRLKMSVGEGKKRFSNIRHLPTKTDT